MRHFLYLLLISLPILSFAADKQYGHWATSTVELGEDKLIIAKTENDSSSVLGFLCMPNTSPNCFTFVNLQITCEEGGKYPALINFGEGIYTESLDCFHLTDKVHFWVIPNEYTNSLVAGNKFGIAYGLTDESFAASYFNLDGSAKALLHAKKSIEKIEKKQKKRKTTHSDVTL